MSDSASTEQRLENLENLAIRTSKDILLLRSQVEEGFMLIGQKFESIDRQFEIFSVQLEEIKERLPNGK